MSVEDGIVTWYFVVFSVDRMSPVTRHYLWTKMSKCYVTVIKSRCILFALLWSALIVCSSMNKHKSSAGYLNLTSYAIALSFMPFLQ